MRKVFFKFNAVLVLLLLACTVMAIAVEGSYFDKSAKKMKAPPTDDNGKYAKEQYRYGVYCMEILEDMDAAFTYLDLAAKQNYRPAWLYLADCYIDKMTEHRFAYLRWAKLCLLAADRLQADADVKFKIGIVEAASGNLEGFKHWMKLAAEGGHKGAAALRESKEALARIKEVQDYREEELADPLKKAIGAHLDKLREYTGPDGAELLDQLTGASVGKSSRMITLPLPKGCVLPQWNYNSAKTQKAIADQLMPDRRGDMRWMTEEFFEQPIWENLLYPSPTIRAINASHEDALLECLNKAAFRRCPPEEVKRLIVPFVHPDAPKDFYDDDIVWDLGGNLYFRIHVASDGRWQLRDYQFFVHKNGKSEELALFPNPPDVADAALVVGIVQGNDDCLNNLAVKFAEGKMDQVFSREEEAENIFKKLVERRHAVGTYNFAMWYLNHGKKSDAEKYFALAEQFAGRSVISYSVNPPEIFDRDGNLLVKNVIYRTGWKNTRRYTRDGAFASALIGFISASEDLFMRPDLEGRAGMEEIISRLKINHPVYMTLDSTLQGKLEPLMKDIAVKSDPRYAYVAVVSSHGELVAAAQSSVFDLKKRQDIIYNPSAVWVGWNFLPAGYLFPVADQWMKLLGSSSTADPLSKEKLQLHVKQGVFAGEAQGVVLGLNRMKGNRDPQQVSGQTATMLNYLCAYIGVKENKAIPKLKVYTDKVNSPIVMQGDVEWISFYRPPDGIVVNALGVIKTADPKTNLYICVRVVPMERDFVSPGTAEEKKRAAVNADIAEKILRDFSLNAKAPKNLESQYAVFGLPGFSIALTMEKIKPGKVEITENNGKKKTLAIDHVFWIGKYEVTRCQWSPVMEDMLYGRCFPRHDPVTGISYDQAVVFCEKLNKLYAGKLPKGYKFYLPSEAEWEYACRAGTTTALNSGKDLATEGKNGQKDANLDEVGWYAENSSGKAKVIGVKKPNAWGLFDMHGNVREWTRSWDPTFYVNSGGRKIVCGGGYSDYASFCQASVRCSTNSCGTSKDLGFRVALVREADVAEDEKIPPVDDEERGE